MCEGHGMACTPAHAPCLGLGACILQASHTLARGNLAPWQILSCAVVLDPCLIRPPPCWRDPPPIEVHK